MTTESTPADGANPNPTETPPAAPPDNTAVTATPPASPSTAVTATPPAVPPAPTPETPPEASPTWPIKVDFALLGLLLLLSFLLASFAAVNSEVWMHFAVGKHISAGQYEFGVDPYSWATEATADKPAVYWVNHSWLFSWILFQLYEMFGGTTLVVLKAIVFTATIGMLARIGWNEANRWFVIICLLMAALAVSSRVLLHPMAISFLFLAITVFVLDRVGVFALKREEPLPDRSGLLWYLPGLFALWANLDQWFILGPMLVGLVWASAGMAKWFPNGNPIPAKTLGLLFGVSLLACLVNPHHIYVFQLPGELAYMLLGVTDALNIPVPEILVAAGRTMKEMTRNEMMGLTLSSLSSTYWQNTGIGLNVAGMSVFPLLVIGLVSFTLVALVKPQPNAPTLQVARFIPWLAFGVLALANYRLIPFFVLIAAPLTAMTLGEFLLWQQMSNEVVAARRDRGLNLARLVCIPFVLLLLYFAWPGWLHGHSTAPGAEYKAAHRVAWTLRPDGELQAAAEVFAGLNADDQCGNVFNISRDLGNYLAWFAPGVKYGVDTRLGLYSKNIATFEKAREALVVDPDLPAASWQDLFRQHNVRQLAAATRGTEAKVLQRWWLTPDQWRTRHGDATTIIVSWAGTNEANQRWPFGSNFNDLDRQAFGPVPPDRRPPATGARPPAQPNMWTLYLEGIPPTPAAVGQSRFHVERFQFAKQMTFQFHVFRALFAASSPVYTAMPGMRHDMDVLLWTNWVSPRDLGPPALPILAVRTARQAVADNPLDPFAHKALLVAGETLRREQEDYWTGGQRMSGGKPSLREIVRQSQLVASAYYAMQTQPDHADNHETLARIYLGQQMYDLALEHRQQAYKLHEANMAAGKYGPKNPTDRAAALRNYATENIDPLEQSVRKRLAYFRSNFDKEKPLDKVGLASRGLFKGEGARVADTPLGLPRKALDLLAEIDRSKLKPEDEVQYLAFSFELPLLMGNVEGIGENLQLAAIKGGMPQGLHSEYRLRAASAVGDYEGMDEALAVLEKMMREQADPLREKVVWPRRGQHAVALTFVPTFPTTPIGMIAASTLALAAQDHLGEGLIVWNRVQNDLYNAMALRGILALEAGDTRRARSLLQTTLDAAGDDAYFSDRVIARRYLDLLNAQK